MTQPSGGAPLNYEALLDQLLYAPDALAMETIARGQGVEIASVARQVEHLKALGCGLEVHPQHGVRLEHSSLATWKDYLRWRDHRQQRTDRIIEVYQRTASTQDVVRRIVMHHGQAADGAVAIADEQTAGRGRQGNRWIAPPGSAVLFSLAWVPKAIIDGAGQTGGGVAGPLSIDRIMFASAVAVARAIEAATASSTRRSLTVSIKWPNDLLVEERKIAGILVETFPVRDGWAAVIGVGINVDLLPQQLPEDERALRGRITSLAMQNCRTDRLRVLAEAMDALDGALNQEDLGPLIAQWRKRSTIMGQHVRLRSNGELIQGQVVDLDPFDGLILRTDSGELLHLPAATTTLLQS